MTTPGNGAVLTVAPEAVTLTCAENLEPDTKVTVTNSGGAR
ncbi:MAG: copper resistance protein CopC [Longispora sp.]|nr:copper resistance protein CopC [Longispora sp. (in: high G+C Gram-positive bacteria)]